MKYVKLKELVEMAKKNPEKFIGKPIFLTNGKLAIVEDVTDEGFVIDQESIIDVDKEIDDSGS